MIGIKNGTCGELSISIQIRRGISNPTELSGLFAPIQWGTLVSSMAAGDGVPRWVMVPARPFRTLLSLVLGMLVLFPGSRSQLTRCVRQPVASDSPHLCSRIAFEASPTRVDIQ